MRNNKLCCALAALFAVLMIGASPLSAQTPRIVIPYSRWVSVGDLSAGVPYLNFERCSFRLAAGTGPSAIYLPATSVSPGLDNKENIRRGRPHHFAFEFRPGIFDLHVLTKLKVLPAELLPQIDEALKNGRVLVDTRLTLYLVYPKVGQASLAVARVNPIPVFADSAQFSLNYTQPEPPLGSVARLEQFCS